MYYFTCVKTSWQNCVLVQVRLMETQYCPHRNTWAVTLLSGTSGSLLLLANARGVQVCASTKHLTPALCTSERISNAAASSPVGSSGRGPFFCALNSLLESVPGTTHSTICVLGAWIPVFWPQKMPDGSALRVPGLQSQGSLAAVPYDTLIEPLLTWPRSVSPTELLCLPGLGMAGAFLMSICSIFGFLLLSQHVGPLFKPCYEYRIINLFVSFSFLSAPCLTPLCLTDVILQVSGDRRERRNEE